MSNVISSNLLKYKVNKNIDGSLEIPKIFLMSRNLRKRGQIAPIEGLVITPKFTEVNECSFTVYKENNGIIFPLFDRIKDNCIVKIEGFGLFQIKVTLHETDAIYKEVTGQCMQACELGQCKCTLEINTEKDTERGDYGEYPTVFYRPDDHPEASLLHRILTYAPTYSIGYVDPSLYNINRQFSCSDTSVYDFLQDVAEEIGCIFVFSHDKRVINVFDAEDHCTNPDCSGSRHIVNGVCQKCKSSQYIEKGYGLDSSTFLDTHNLLEEITDTIDADSIKNCFKLVAGDDTTTNLIGQRLIGNSPYIWTFSDFEIEEFSNELREKWLSYEPFVETYQEEFNKQWDIINDCINQKLYWMSGKMPVVENPTVDASDPTKSCKNIYDEITSKITYTTLSSKKTVETTVANQVLNYAKLICPEGYEVSYQVNENGKKKYSSVKNSEGIITSFTAYIYICLKNCKDTEDSSKDRYFYKSAAWTIPVKSGYDLVNKDGLFTSDYYLYLKQQMEIAYAKADIVYQPKYDTDYDDGVANHLKDPDYYKNYFKEYGIQRLTSFKEAYDTCTVSLFEQNSSLTEGSEDTERKYVQLTGVQSKVSLYEELSGRYIAYSAYIETIIEEYTQIYKDYDEKQLAAKEQVDKINATCNLKTYLGNQLFSELLTFKREDTYENKNYSSDVVDEATLMSNIEEFIVAAKQEIAKACQPKHEIAVKMSQLLTLSDYETVVDAFAVGNYVRSRVNDEIVKMRIVSIPINFTDIEQSDVTFSDSLVGNTQLKSMQEQIQKATSMATSFGFVEKQSERNNEQVNTMSQSISDGLNATKNMIMNSDNQDVVIDTHGILGRELDPNTNTYLDEQYRAVNKGIIYTDNGWDTIKAALGKIYFGGKWQYGLIGEAVVGKLIAGEQLEISDSKGTVKIDGNGIKLSSGAVIDWDNVDAPEISNINGLSDRLDQGDENLNNYKKEIAEFQDAVNGSLGVTKITSTAIISPKLGGGYLYISKDGCSVQIDPSQVYDSKNSKVINVQANNKDVFYINRDGSGYFAGEVIASKLTLGTNVKVSTDNISGLSTVATSGKYGDLTGNPDLTVYAKSDDVDTKLKGYATTGALDAYLKTNDLSTKLDGLNVSYRGDVTTTQTTDATTGLITTTSSYVGSDGKTYTNKIYTYPDSDYVLLSRENKWGTGSTAGDGKNLVKISKDGLLTANNAIIYGTVYATDGEFTGKVTATSGEFKGAVSIEGTSNLDRMQVHSGNSYTRQDYEKFYSGDNVALAKATNAIYIGQANVVTGSRHDYIEGWYNGHYPDLLSDPAENFLLCSSSFRMHRNYVLDTDGNIDKTKPYNSFSVYLNNSQGELELSSRDKETSKANTSILTPTELSISDDTNTSTLTNNKLTTTSVQASSIIMSSSNFNIHTDANPGFNFNSSMSPQFYPDGNNLALLGTSSNKWKEVWSNAYNGTSDRKLKTDINDIDLDWATDFIDGLKPSTYKFKDNRYGKTHTGFIAQDVEEVMLSLGMKRTDFAGLVKSRKHSETPSGINTVEELNDDPDNFEGDDENYDYSLRYDDFIAPIVAYIQNLKKQNTELENKLNKIYEKLGLSD
ncbi:tail fiber domain-containing protein [Jutongia sp.]|uniref:tail fiber domain-containing protein n=1 Tax=Jutongia sp. TaxID=2944204 RepID=UPI003080E147